MNNLFKKILFLLILFIFIVSGCKKDENSVSRDNPVSLRYREAVIDYMAQPDFTNKGFSQQVTGTEAELKLYDLDEMMLYFAINKTDFDSARTLRMLTVNPENAQFGFLGNGVMVLGEYILRGTERLLFRIPKNDFIVDTSRKVNVNYGEYNYTVSISELTDFAENVSIYGMNRNSQPEENLYVADHGAFIAGRNEPSLTRLVRQITDSSAALEINAQRLLDFVTTRLKFSSYEAYGGYEVLKRPNEVLMTGKSDCSGLTILYASLLEQIGADYVLAYYPGHICVGVSGSFPKVNGQNFNFEGKNYTVAESTVKGFQLGLTFLQKDFNVSDIKFIQKPGKESVITRFTQRH